MTYNLKDELAALGISLEESGGTPYADRLSKSRPGLGTQISVRDQLVQRLKNDGFDLDEPEPIEAVEPTPAPALPAAPAPLPIPPLGSRYGVAPAAPSTPTVIETVPNAADVTLASITVWDNWGGDKKPPVEKGRRTPPLQWGVTIELWTDPADTIPTRSTDRMKLVSLRATTRLLNHDHFVGGAKKLHEQGSISAAYLARLIANHGSSSFLGLRTGTFQEQTGNAGSPYIKDTDCFIEMDVRGLDAPYSCKLHLNGGHLVIRSEDWSDKQVNGAPLPGKNGRVARWQCRFDRDSAFGNSDWKTK